MTADDALRAAAAGIAGSSGSSSSSASPSPSPSSSQPSLLEDDITPFPSPMLSPQELEDLSREPRRARRACAANAD